MDRRHFLSTVGAGAATGVAGCTGLLEPPDSADDGPPRLGVDGRWLTDPDGNRIVLRGVTVVDPWWGTTYADLRGKGYWETLKLATDEDAGWHTHVLRVPIRPRSIKEEGLETVLEAHLDRAVSLARERGVYLVIAYQAIERYDTRHVDDRLTTFWDRVAPRYADESHVLFDLFSAPTQPADNGRRSWLNWRDTAQPWVDRVRDYAPETPIIVGSPRWNSMTGYAPEDPFDDDNVVYAFHANPSWDPESWEETFGDPALDVPLFATEWGYVNVENDDTEPHMIGSTEGWGRPFRTWLDSHANVSWCARTFDSRRQPKMFDDAWELLGGNDYMGELTKNWLADARDTDWPPGRPAAPATPKGENRPPSAPRNLRVTEKRQHSLRFAWTSSTDPDGDAVVQYRVTLDGTEVEVLRGSTHEVGLTGLEPGETYQVGVAAVDARGLPSADVATATATTVEVATPVTTLSHTNEEPTMDGSLDEFWSSVPVHPIENALMPGPPDNDFDGEWRAVWDESALYYLVSVVDDDAVTDSEEAWKNDIVEIYVDPDNSQRSSYDDENDAQLLFERGHNLTHVGTHTFDGFDYGAVRVDQTETADGWRIAVAIPWRELGTTPSMGHRIGMDVHVADDVDGGERDAKIGWYSTDDDSWKVPATFALVELGE